MVSSHRLLGFVGEHRPGGSPPELCMCILCFPVLDIFPAHDSLLDFTVLTALGDHYKSQSFPWIWGSHSGCYKEFCIFGIRWKGANISGAGGLLCLLPASFWFLAWFTLRYEYGVDMFLRNVGWLSQATQLYVPEFLVIHYCSCTPSWGDIGSFSRAWCVIHSLYQCRLDLQFIRL
jgi:hypothetical protein